MPQGCAENADFFMRGGVAQPRDVLRQSRESRGLNRCAASLLNLRQPSALLLTGTKTATCGPEIGL